VKRIGLAAILTLLLAVHPTTPADSAQKVSPGGNCKAINQKVVYLNKTYTCIKSGKKFVWSIGKSEVKKKATPPVDPSSNPTRSPAPNVVPITAENYEFKDICDPDPFVPAIWKEFQDAEMKFNGCPPPYRHLLKELANQLPKLSQTPTSELQPVAECKLLSTRGWTGSGPLGSLKNKATVIQIVPFYMNGEVPTQSPAADWSKYLDFALDSLRLMADTDVKIEIRLPSQYIKVDGDLESFQLGMSTDSANQAFSENRWRLINQVVPVADRTIDFSDADTVWFLAPSNVSRTIFSHQIAHSRVLNTNEKQFSIYNSYFMSIPPSDFPKNGYQAREPMGFLHELMHIFNTLDDHRDGGGNWGNMSGARMDFLMWDKGSMSWIADSQIRCAPSKKSSVHWIKPSTIRGSHEKLVIVPLGNRKAIAIESIRSSGFNFKLPRSMNGALVYTIDTELLDNRSSYEDGISVVCPLGRSCSEGQSSRNFSLAGAALKLGESTSIDGYSVTVLESGEFGDVVRVDKN
jgi:hypothetical protein